MHNRTLFGQHHDWPSTGSTFSHGRNTEEHPGCLSTPHPLRTHSRSETQRPVRPARSLSGTEPLLFAPSGHAKERGGEKAGIGITLHLLLTPVIPDLLLKVPPTSCTGRSGWGCGGVEMVAMAWRRAGGLEGWRGPGDLGTWSLI